MAKPIFIIDAPVDTTPERLDEIIAIVGDKLNDYHVLVVCGSTEGFKFKGFYEKDFTEINFEELKDLFRK